MHKTIWQTATLGSLVIAVAVAYSTPSVFAADKAPPQTNVAPKADSTEIAFWESVDKYDPAQLRAYLTTYPHGAFAGLARLRLKEINEDNNRESALHANLVNPLQSPAHRPQISPQKDARLTTTELRLVRQQIEACWSVPAGTPENITPRFRVDMNPDGTVRSATLINPDHLSDPFFQAAADSARRALFNPNCQPLKLPPQKYAQWQTFTLTFDSNDLN